MMKILTHDNKTSGQACVELAVILPLLVLLLLGVYDFACAIRANNTISNMSREGGNLSSRSSFAMQDIMNSLAVTAQPLDMQNNGMIYVTVVQGAVGQPRIQSQEGWQSSNLKDTISSRIGTPTPSDLNPLAQNLGTLTLGPSQTVRIVEVFYNYRSLFSSNVARLASQFYSKSIF
jgi:Flp pilus assembly protein TadG